jgi:hypothetical protein
MGSIDINRSQETHDLEAWKTGFCVSFAKNRLVWGLAGLHCAGWHLDARFWELSVTKDQELAAPGNIGKHLATYRRPQGIYAGNASPNRGSAVDQMNRADLL